MLTGAPKPATVSAATATDSDPARSRSGATSRRASDPAARHRRSDARPASPESNLLGTQKPRMITSAPFAETISRGELTVVRRVLVRDQVFDVVAHEADNRRYGCRNVHGIRTDYVEQNWPHCTRAIDGLLLTKY